MIIIKCQYNISSLPRAECEFITSDLVNSAPPYD